MLVEINAQCSAVLPPDLDFGGVMMGLIDHFLLARTPQTAVCASVSVRWLHHFGASISRVSTLWSSTHATHRVISLDDFPGPGPCMEITLLLLPAVPVTVSTL
jgi:hypothetical protein